MTTLQPPARGFASAERARVAVALVFALNGVAFASWISRLPAIRDALDLTSGQLGLLLLCLSTGSVLALPTSGAVVQKVGPAQGVRGAAALTAAGLLVVSLALVLPSVPLAAVALFATGFGIATWDVSMNVEAADVERRLGRTLMPRFHAGFSVGTVAGALVGAAAAAGGVSPATQLTVTALFVIAAVAAAARTFLPVHDDPGHDTRSTLRLRAAWREPRTLTIGLLVLSSALVEGIANDWLALAATDGHDQSDVAGALVFGVFVSAMTVARFAGGSLLERWGRPAVLRALTAVALVGLLLVVLGPSMPWVAAGALLWGLGASLGFPVGMSAAADDPHGAAVRVSVVSSIGYAAFLGGPPLIGFLADAVGILDALLVVPLALALCLLVAGSTRPPASPIGG